ncbi:MAG: hypothetical protein WB507_10745 [Solirubrobacterales bacterium]
MRNIRFVVLALGAIVALVALGGCGSSKTHGEEGSVKLIEPGGNSGMVTPFGKFNGKTFTPGTGIVIANPLQNTEKKTMGEINAVCLSTQPTVKGFLLSGTCSGTATVPGGSFALNVGGKGAIGGTVSGSITGGTGKYNGAVGNFSSKAKGGGESPMKEDTFNYILP